jgi:hypothetical protein
MKTVQNDSKLIITLHHSKSVKQIVEIDGLDGNVDYENLNSEKWEPQLLLPPPFDFFFKIYISSLLGQS